MIDFKVLQTQILTQNALRILAPPNISPLKYKSQNMCLKMSISQGLIFEILLYLKYDRRSKDSTIFKKDEFKT